MRLIIFMVLTLSAIHANADTWDAPNHALFPETQTVGMSTIAPSNAPDAQPKTAHTDAQIIRPNMQVTPVPISVSQVNYLQCKNGVINDHTFSTEKPLLFTPKNGGKSAFIKLKARQNESTGKLYYFTESVELYVTCDEQVYILMLKPTMTSTKVIILDGGKAKAMQATVNTLIGMPKEDIAIDILDKVHAERGNLASAFQVTRAPSTSAWLPITAKTNAKLREKIKLDGSGLTVYKYQFYSRQGDSLHEMDVVNAQLQQGVFAVRLYDLTPKPNATFIGYVVTWEAL